MLQTKSDRLRIEMRQFPSLRPWFRARVFFVIVVLLVAVPTLAGFSPAAFNFAPVVPEDDKGQGGGWQEATATLKFVDTRPLFPRIWSCRMRIGMPLRTAAYGRISPEFAADVTAEIATDASTDIMHSREEWMIAEFCKAFKDEMSRLFLDRYRELGARVNSP